MNLIQMPSLEHIALVKIGTTLWNHRNIKTSIETVVFLREEYTVIESRWQEIENNVLENASLLYPTGILREKIKGVIKPIGLQIFQWTVRNVNKFTFGFNEGYELCWTPVGTLDQKKTAKAFVNDETRDIIRRFKVACIYCLESDIRTIWENMSQCDRKYVYEFDKEFLCYHCDQLVYFWTRQIRGFQDKTENCGIEFEDNSGGLPFPDAVDCAAENDKIGFEYFFNTLTPSGKKGTIQYILKRKRTINYPRLDILHFLLLQVNEEQRLKIFETYPDRVLEGFLQWPFQVFFAEVTDHVIGFLYEEDCDWLLNKIVDKVLKGYTDYDYQKLFGEFWHKMEAVHKQYVIHGFASWGYTPPSSLLQNLFKVKFVKNISLILKDASAEEENRICFHSIDNCISLALSGEWNLLEFFLNEIISSPGEMVAFKGRCKKLIVGPEDMSDADKQKLFQLFDDLIRTRFKKRCAKEENFTQSTKRLCSSSAKS